MKARRLPLLFVHLAMAAFFGCFLFFPIWHVLRGGLFDEQGRFTLVFLQEVFRNPLYLEGLSNAFTIAVCSTLVSLLIAVPVAWLSERFEFPGKRLLAASLLLPLILPPFVGALGMQRIFGHYGAINAVLTNLGFLAPHQARDWLGSGGFSGIVLIESLHLYPILYLNAVAAFANVDPLLSEASADLGCVGVRRFIRITLPLVMPGIFAGSALVFVWSFTELGTPLMFNFTRITSVQIFDGITEIGDNPMPYALVIVMMSASAALYLLARLTFGRRAYAMTSKAGVAASGTPLKGLPGLCATGVLACLVFGSVLPHLGVIGIAAGGCWHRTVLPSTFTMGHFEAALGHGLTVTSIMNSVRYAGMATVLAMGIGIAIAYLVVRCKLRFNWLYDSLAMLPLSVPGLVLAFGYLAMTQKGRLFHFLDPAANPTALLVIAYAVRRLPYVVRAAVAGLQQTSVSFEEAASDLGAPPLLTFRRITVPLIAANLIAGGILAFSFSMLEVSDSLLLAQRSLHYPITKAIYELSMHLGEGQAMSAALGVWTMVFLGTSLLVASLLLGKRLGALFRV